MKTLAVTCYLLAIVAGNLLAARFGAWATPAVGFFLIGLDLTLRDLLHQGWQERGVLKRNMALLVLAGSWMTLIANPHAARIALASTLAFALETVTATAVYWLCFRWPRLWKMNAANVAGGLVDSLTFPTVAFGQFLPLVILAQWGAKAGGGLLWSLVLTRRKNLDPQTRVGHTGDPKPKPMNERIT